MSDILIIKDGSGGIQVVRRTGTDKKSVSMTPVTGDPATKDRRVEDVIDLDAGRTLAAKIRAEKDPEKIKAALQEGQKNLTENMERFRGMMFGRSLRSMRTSFFTRLRALAVYLMNRPNPAQGGDQGNTEQSKKA